jgi:hypothetical protein
MKRLIVGQNENEARIYHTRGKQKLMLISEAVEIASKFIKIESVKDSRVIYLPTYSMKW